MKLNADIVYEWLSQSYDLKMHGSSPRKLNLARPVFYMEGQKSFKAGTLTLASADHLPMHPSVEKEAALVCVGESLQLSRFIGACPVIQIPGQPDFFSVYLSIQEVFDRYDRWNDELFELFKADADIQKIVSLSAEVFGYPVMVVDRNFQVLAASEHVLEEAEKLWKDENDHLSRYSMEHYLSANELHIDEHEPLFLEIVDTNALCVNLFDRSDGYLGCLCILISEASARPGLDALAEYLARAIEVSIQKNPSMITTEHNARKGVLEKLVSGKPIGPNQRWLLEPSSPDDRFVCVTLRSFGQDQALPSSYLCNSFELSFPGSYAFPFGETIVGVVDLAEIGADDSDYRESVESLLNPLIDSLKLGAGVSFAYSELADTPVYIEQAEAAFTNGMLMDSELRLHHFPDHALTEMVINSFAGLPIESLFTPGLRRILEHDLDSPISYLETLRVFLRENMNYTKVSSELFIHRSTLVDRIEKIEKGYGIDLHDPDVRLYLQLILRGLELGQAFKTTR